MEILTIGTPWNLCKLNKSVAMSSMVVCPNCRHNLLPYAAAGCHSTTSVPYTASCRSVEQNCAKLCLIPSHSKNIPLPYVCRHWMQRSSQESCEHCYTSKVTLGGLSSGGCCQQIIPSTCSCNCSIKKRMGCSRMRPFSTLSCPVGKENIHHCVAHCHRKCEDDGFSVSNHLFSNDIVCTVSEVWTEEDDLRVLNATKAELEQSGWYYGCLSWQEANALLENKTEGTFLVRDSSNSRCPYAVSVQTSQGPTSVRIEYERGRFWLSCEKKGVTPQLKGVIELLEFYQSMSGKLTSRRVADENLVWVDHKGLIFSSIKIIRPLTKAPQSLQHLCRLAIKKISNLDTVTLPSPIQKYLLSYDHSL